MSFHLLSRLWLREPDAEALALARGVPWLAPHVADPADLAVAYADLLLLNVYPYASIYLDPDGEMDGARAQHARRVYERFGYAPAALDDAGAPDHIGLMLGLLAHTGPDGPLAMLLDWAPVFCLAVEREAAAHPFYRALAGGTRRALFAPLLASGRPAEAPPSGAGGGEEALPMADPEEEVSARAIVRWMLCPARSGMFLSRAAMGRWARDLGMPLPFAARLDVGLALFEAAGAVGELPRLVDLLAGELRAWDAAYARWAQDVPAWAAFAAGWRARTASAGRVLAEMRALAEGAA